MVPQAANNPKITSIWLWNALWNFFKQPADFPGFLDSSPVIKLEWIPGEWRQKGHSKIMTHYGGAGLVQWLQTLDENGRVLTWIIANLLLKHWAFLLRSNKISVVAMLIMHSFYICTLALFCFNQKTDCWFILLPWWLKHFPELEMEK